MPTTVKERLMEEIDDLPPAAQEKIVKLVHFLKEEILLDNKKSQLSAENWQAQIPKMQLGKILTSLRREDIYEDDGR